MSFTIRSTAGPRNFSSLSSSSSQAQRGLRSSAGSMFGGAGGTGARISMSSAQSVSNTQRPYFQDNSGAVANSAAFNPVNNEKQTMQDLNSRLDKYVSRVRELEDSNRKLEEQIKEALLKKGADNGNDWSGYDHPLMEVRKQIREMARYNAQLLLQIDNARLAADDFKVKYESEQAIRQGVEQDIAGLRKIIDDTQLSQTQLESQHDSTMEELNFLKGNHEEEVAGLRTQITASDVSVEMDSPKGPDISEIIAKIRGEYEKTAQKNREDTDAWYQSKFDSLSAEASQNSEELQSGKNNLYGLNRQHQAHQIDLEALRNLKSSLEGTLNDTEGRYAGEMNKHNQRLLDLEAELAQVRAQVERQGQDYQSLFNIKMKLESEIATYQSLLEGGPDDDRVEFSLEQALQAVPQPEKPKEVMVLNREVVDGEVVSQTKVEVQMAPPNDAEQPEVQEEQEKQEEQEEEKEDEQEQEKEEEEEEQKEEEEEKEEEAPQSLAEEEEPQQNDEALSE
ncbi:keratin, type I cytoskeletal 18-like [Megalops cyprinoides]|uniref:keratin, type I cytoskeletal 18-like n=1 Tax=Megalops cyprinoides TaxID=118141 RepID=UPI0018640D0B|nr:keratin, type I cytoskeletal 18-like [Megalops cyprinoides]